jgi:uncharacterized protein
VKPALVVIAKEPRPGRAKTRLSPPCTPAEAAALAAAALEDTLAAAATVPAGRRILALEGAPGRWVPRGFDVVAQATGGLDARLGAALEAAGGPALAIGMDTPQLTPELLGAGLDALSEPGVDAVLGPAADGGYWAIGLRRPDRGAVAGVPMSVPWTAAAQRDRLDKLGLRRRELPELRDVDTYEDARAVAAGWPATRFARRLRETELLWRAADALAAGTG